jgi:hypothetical protein
MRHLVLLVGFIGLVSACGSNSTVSNSGSILPEKAGQPAAVSKAPVVAEANPRKSKDTVAVVAVPIPRNLLEPEIMIGRTDSEVREIFGAPTLQRIDDPAEVWQYLASDCAMHLFFYPEGQDSKMTVQHISINGRKQDVTSAREQKLCFNDHLRRIGAEEALKVRNTS